MNQEDAKETVRGIAESAVRHYANSIVQSYTVGNCVNNWLATDLGLSYIDDVKKESTDDNPVAKALYSTVKTLLSEVNNLAASKLLERINALITKHRRFVSNVQWHIDTNKPKGDELRRNQELLRSLIDTVADLEALKSN